MMYNLRSHRKWIICGNHHREKMPYDSRPAFYTGNKSFRKKIISKENHFGSESFANGLRNETKECLMMGDCAVS